MKVIALLAALCSACGNTAAQGNAQDPCYRVKLNPAPNKIPLPVLPTTAFKAVVRAEISNKQMTVEAVEYADESLNKGAIVLTQGGTTSTLIMSYGTNEVFYIAPNSDSGLSTAGPMACVAKNLTTDDNTQLFGMAAGGSASVGGSHLYSTAKILNFINGTEVYKGQVTIGNIPANQWSSCVYWPELNANFTLDYYFTIPGWKTPSGLDQIPLRAEINGVTTLKNGSSHTFHHIYQYVNFEPYVSDPETVFETPPGVYCLFRKSTRQLPKLNNHFYYREEISNPGLNNGNFPVISENDIWYDYDLQLVRYDQRSQPDGVYVSADFSQSSGPYKVIQDFTLGVQYVIAADLGTCSVDPIPMDASGFTAVLNTTSHTLALRDPNKFWNLNSASYLYAGQRKARGQTCDVFQTVLTDLPGGITVYEVYFLSPSAEDVTDRGSDSAYSTLGATPMRLMMWQGGVLAEQYEIHNFDQDSPNARNFDVSPCYTGKNSVDFEVFLKVRDTSLMPVLQPYVDQLMRLQVSVNAGITPLRVQKTRLHWDNRMVYYEGTILGAAPSIAKYSHSLGMMMSGVDTKALQNVEDLATCAQQCDNLQEWNCVQFDYCPSTLVCTLGRHTNPATLVNSTGCNHYQRVLGGGFDSQAPIDQVWESLKNRVYGGGIVIDLPNPDKDGKVDLQADTSTLDDTQKTTLTAVAITNQVVSDVQRNPVSDGVMQQFTSIPEKEGKGYQTLVRGVSVDECANDCLGEDEYSCQSFHYCWDAGACFLSPLHPDERPNLLKTNTACDLYIRDYTSNFQKFDGQTVLSGSDTIYQNVQSASACAKLCTYYSNFHCESFDFCDDVSTCFLGATHYYDAPKANIQQAPSCTHYSRNYISDFTVKYRKQVPLRDNRIVQNVSPAQCAKLCVEEGSFQCNSFDFCGNFSECRLSDASLSGVGQTTLEPNAFCSVYIRQYGKGSAPQASADTGSTYTTGSMAGLGLGMIVLGIVLGLAALLVYDRVSKRGADDGMAIQFSKHENEG